MAIHSKEKSLTPEQKQKLKAYIAEMKSRGLSIPDSLNKDGRIYNPSEAQESFINSDARFILYAGGRGSGKCLSIDTPICTVDGWKNLEDIQVGDIVFDEDGNQTKVVFSSDIMYEHPCYKVVFSDDSFLIADGEHRWSVLTAKTRKSVRRRLTNNGIFLKRDYSIVTTEHIKDTISLTKRGDVNYSIDCAKPLICDTKQLTIPPYTLGVWLGDGNSSGSGITIGEDSKEIIKFIEDDGLIVKKLDCDPLSYSIDFPNSELLRDKETGRFTRNENSFYSKLSDLDLIKNKHIPQGYLRASYSQRFALLQGLMDTDGCCGVGGKCEFDSCSESIANGFEELAISLGFKVNKKVGHVIFKDKKIIRYRFSFVPHEEIFRITYKLNNITPKGNQYLRTKRRYIKQVIPIETVPVKCIEVDSESHLYLAGKRLIPTHNTSAGAQKALQKIREGKSGAIYNPDYENFKISTWAEFKDWIPWDHVVPAHRYRQAEEFDPGRPFTLVFNNGARVYCKGVKDPGSARGSNVNWLWYDEAGRDNDGLSWKVAIASVRVGENPQAWCTATARGRSHWMYEFFVEQKFPPDVLASLEEIKKETGKDFNLIEWFQGSIEDNKANLDPFFYTSMLASYPPGWFRDQELHGEFVDEGGVLGDPSWFNGKVLPLPLENVDKRIRYWDLAASEAKIVRGKKITDPDSTVGTKFSYIRTGSEDVMDRFYIEDQIGGQWEIDEIQQKIIEIAEKDGQKVPIYIEQEPGSGGKNQVAMLSKYIKSKLPGWVVNGHRPEGDKIIRANVWFAEAAHGNIWIVRGKWNDDFFKELGSFPNAKHDDRIDSVSGARHVIAPLKKWSSAPFLSLSSNIDERLSDERPNKIFTL